MEFTKIIIETIDGTIQLYCKILYEWSGVCGNYKLLESIDGKIYWWLIINDGIKNFNKIEEFENLQKFHDDVNLKIKLDNQVYH